MSTCKAKTKSGNPCKNSPVEGSDYCYIKSHQEQEGKTDLTVKQERFIEEYLIDYNATQAAIRAGYSEKSAYEIGSQNLRKVEIAEQIKERLNRLSMTAEEALKRMTDWGRGTFKPFLQFDEQNGTLKIDMSNPEALENLHLIKKIKQKDTIVKGASEDDPSVVTDRTFEIELHDAKDAVDKLIKVHGLYVENVNMNVRRADYDPANGDPEDYVQKRLQKGD